MAGRNKRRVDFVDLTHNDQENAQRPTKLSRNDRVHSVLANVSNGQRFGESAAYIPFSQRDDDEAGVDDLVPSTQGVDETDLNSFEIYGCLNTKIVGVRFYSGYASIGERVSLVREPTNKYDANAIKVNNVMGAQIGHIPRNFASDLAKYMDERVLVLEGMLTGSIGTYDCPIAITLFGPTDPLLKQQTRLRMRDEKLPINELMRNEQDRARKEWQRRRMLKEAEEKKKRADMQRQQGGLYPNHGTGMVDPTDLEDLYQQSSAINITRMGQGVQSFGSMESELAKMPMAEIPIAMKTQLLSYQRQGLAWMLGKESPKLPETESEKNVQLWKKKAGRYKNMATGFATSQPPPLASGGILADDMGLGKTIQIISLIMANSKVNADNGITAPTLIVSPLGVMSNWKQQIEAHVKPEYLPNIHIYHGTIKKETGKNLSQYGVVITTYGAVTSEYDPVKKTAKTTKNGLFSIQWRRVVLDEGHTIRNPRSKGALAACHLKADSRWTLTGTPIINSLKDLYSQVRFLRLSGGLQDLSMFNAALIRPLNSGQPAAASLLKALMQAICLRRRKDMSFVNLRLPPMKMHVLRVKFHPHELEKYEMFQAEAQGMLEKYRSSASKDRIATYSHVLETLLRLRQVCNHWALCKNRVNNLLAMLDKNKVVELTPENIKALQDMLQIQIESQETCAICLDNLSQPVITACAHAYDRGCIEQVIERQHKCPLCRAEIQDTNSLVSPGTELGEDDGAVDVDASAPSSKVEALVKILTAKGQAEGTKTVVFSQWTSFLDIIEPHLTQHGVRFTRIDGKLNSNKRDQAISDFSNDPNFSVLLASLNVCSVGLNLVAANQVVLCDSWWAPAIEDQAIDRVYRLGQTRETTVWRLVMEGSVEDRVLEIQDSKRTLSSTALSEADHKKGESTNSRLADLEKLLGKRS